MTRFFAIAFAALIAISAQAAPQVPGIRLGAIPTNNVFTSNFVLMSSMNTTGGVAFTASWTSIIEALGLTGGGGSGTNDNILVNGANASHADFTNSTDILWTLTGSGPSRLSATVTSAITRNVDFQAHTNRAVLTNSLQAGKTLLVDAVFGNDTLAKRENGIAFATPLQAKTNALAGDFVHVRAGTFVLGTNHNLAKNGVNWYFDNGAEVIRDGAGAARTEEGIFEDHGEGAMVFSVGGYGTFIVSNGYAMAINFTNRASRVNLVGRRWHNKSNGPLIYHAESDVTVLGYEQVRADLYDLVWSEPAGGVVSSGTLYVDAHSWYAGDNLVECKSFATNGNCVLSARFAESPTLNDGQTLLAGSNVVVRFGTMLTSGTLNGTGAGVPEYNIGRLEFASTLAVAGINAPIWLRNCSIYSPGATTPVMAASPGSTLENVSIQTGASNWVTSFFGTGGYVTNYGFLQVNNKTASDEVRVVGHVSPALKHNTTNGVETVSVHGLLNVSGLLSAHSAKITNGLTVNGFTNDGPTVINGASFFDSLNTATFDGAAVFNSSVSLGASATATTLAVTTLNAATQNVGTINLTNPVPMAAGGSGSSLTDPGAHAVWAWDNTNNSNRLATLSGITYDPSGNTLTAAGGGGQATPGVNYVASAATIIIDLALTNAPIWTVTNAANSHISCIISNPAPGRWWRFKVWGSGTATNNNLATTGVAGTTFDWAARATNTFVASNGWVVVSGVFDNATNATLAFRTEAQ